MREVIKAVMGLVIIGGMFIYFSLYFGINLYEMVTNKQSKYGDKLNLLFLGRRFVRWRLHGWRRTSIIAQLVISTILVVVFAIAVIRVLVVV